MTAVEMDELNVDDKVSKSTTTIFITGPVLVSRNPSATASDRPSGENAMLQTLSSGILPKAGRFNVMKLDNVSLC
jgi:hypothetical protein